MHLSPLRRVAALAVLAGALVVPAATAPATANAVTPMPPNLRALPAADLSITTNGNDMLLLSATTWNDGAGPLELRGGEVEGTGKQRVYQRIHQSDGSIVENLAGSFSYHPGHAHTHFDDYAKYSLQSVDNPGNPQRFGAKMTFCIIDTYVADLALPGAPPSPVYRFCNNDVQGMSVGWGDIYPYYLEGQAIDIDGLPSGDYYLRVEADPQGHLVESDETDNVSTIVVRIQSGVVSVLDSDDDGCDDAQEQGLSPDAGGRRDPLDPWDFYDVTSNGAIDLSDTLAVLGKFGLQPGNAGYDAAFDRVRGDPDPWRTTAATGAHAGIDLEDALANLASFGHTCADP